MTASLSKQGPIVHPHDEVFYKLGGSDFPSIEELLQLKIPADLQPNQILPDELHRKVESNLNLIHHVCRWHLYDPIVTELAVIADERLIPAGQIAYFLSYISSFISNDRQVIQAYIDAMKFMNTPESGQDPVVPHKKLYEPANALITINPSRLQNRDDNVDTLKSQLVRENAQIRAYRYDFRPGKSELPVAGQVAKFRKEFLEKITNAKNLEGISKLLQACHFILLPFVRPYYRPATMVEVYPPGQYRGTPAGAFFLFLYQKAKKYTVLELARALTWLMASAGLKESYSSLDVTLTKKALFGSMVHGSVNAIRSIATTSLCNLLANRVPPQSVEDLSIRIFRKDKNEEDTKTAELLIDGLAGAMMGEDTAAALLSFAEMHLSEGYIRQKFQNEEPVAIGQLIQEALSMIGIETERTAH